MKAEVSQSHKPKIFFGIFLSILFVLVIPKTGERVLSKLDKQERVRMARIYTVEDLVIGGMPEILKLKLAQGGDPNALVFKSGEAVIFETVRNERLLDALGILLDHDVKTDIVDSEGRGIFFEASRCGNLDALNLLKARGVIPTKTQALRAIDKARIEEVRAFFDPHIKDRE